MSIVTMDMSSFEIERNPSVSDELTSSGWNSAQALQLYTENSERIFMPQDMIAMDSDIFMKKMYAIEVDAEVFLKNMYAWQQ